MKQKLIAALTLPVLLVIVVAPANAIETLDECGTRGTCLYDRNTYLKGAIAGAKTQWTDKSTCIAHEDCWADSRQICMNLDGGYDRYKDDCGKNCENKGYEVAVLAADGLGDYKMGCACYSLTQWQTYKTGVLREYVRNGTGGAPCTVQTTNNFRCASGYYGTPDSNGNGCISCTGKAGMYCPGGTTFSCTDGYYKNGGACTKCPDSRVGNLGWNTSNNGVAGEGGDGGITSCFIAVDSVLRDATGTFELQDDCYYSN